jgi:hypothetical protein
MFVLVLIGSVAGLVFLLLPRRKDARPVAGGRTKDRPRR